MKKRILQDWTSKQYDADLVNTSMGVHLMDHPMKDDVGSNSKVNEEEIKVQVDKVIENTIIRREDIIKKENVIGLKPIDQMKSQFKYSESPVLRITGTKQERGKSRSRIMEWAVHCRNA